MILLDYSDNERNGRRVLAYSDSSNPFVPGGKMISILKTFGSKPLICGSNHRRVGLDDASNMMLMA